jgi:hypothetical protein
MPEILSPRVIAAALAVLVSRAAAAQSQDPALVGAWTATRSWPSATHTHLLPTGVVMFFRPAARKCGIEIEVPLMEGRDMITSIIMSPETRIDASHVVTNTQEER